MAEPAVADRVRALPILLLVLGALSAGSGGWCFIARPPATTAGLVLLASSAVLFFSAVAVLRKPPGRHGVTD